MGGLQGILISIIYYALGILNFNYLDNFLASKLYKAEVDTLFVSQTEIIKEYCLSNCLLRKLICCHTKRKEIAMERARSAL